MEKELNKLVRKFKTKEQKAFEEWNEKRFQNDIWFDKELTKIRNE